jgi:hypothetical protein
MNFFTMVSTSNQLLIEPLNVVLFDIESRFGLRWPSREVLRILLLSDFSVSTAGGILVLYMYRDGATELVAHGYQLSAHC